MKFLTPLTYLLLVLLSACSSVETKYYRLTDSSFQAAATAANIELQVELAPYLNKPNLVYLPDANQVQFSKQHLWAENLANAIANSLANNLNQLDRENNYASNHLGKQADKLLVVIESFYGVAGGEVVIQGYAQNYSHSGELQRQRAFNLRERQSQDGYAGMVKSLSQGLAKVAGQLVAE